MDKNNADKHGQQRVDGRDDQPVQMQRDRADQDRRGNLRGGAEQDDVRYCAGRVQAADGKLFQGRKREQHAGGRERKREDKRQGGWNSMGSRRMDRRITKTTK